jgi:hypothetical protein
MAQRFVAADVAAEIANRLWRYLSQSSTSSEIAAVAESLFSLPRNELSRLTAAHLAESEATASMLDAAAIVLRELPSSVTRSEVELRTAIRQPVLWPRTYQRQLRTGDDQRFVCRPPERGYDTPLAQLLLLALHRCAELPQLAQLPSKGTLGAKVAARAATAKRLRKHAKLRDVRLVERLPERTLGSLGRYRDVAPLIAWLRQATEALDDRSPRVMRAVIEKRLLPPSRESSLFELFVGFALVDAFVVAGFTELPARLIPNRDVPLARLRRGVEEVSVHWQRPLWKVEGVASSDGRYGGTLDDAGLSQSQLRPDFVIKASNPARLAFVEVKLTTQDGKTAERGGVQDALAYAYDAESLLEKYPEPHGLVVAWNASGRPGPGKLVVADQGSVALAVKAMLGQWAAA